MNHEKTFEAINKLKEVEIELHRLKNALEMTNRALETKNEPVAWMCADESLINKGYARFSHVCMGEWKIPVYTIPPQRTWVGLTYDEETELIRLAHNHAGIRFYIQATEAKLKEKNT